MRKGYTNLIFYIQFMQTMNHVIVLEWTLSGLLGIDGSAAGDIYWVISFRFTWYWWLSCWWHLDLHSCFPLCMYFIKQHIIMFILTQLLNVKIKGKLCALHVFCILPWLLCKPRKSCVHYSATHEVSIHPKMAGNSLLGAHVFIYSFHLLGNQFSKMMCPSILKILKSMMTLAAIFTRRRNILGHLVL
jgi:hypothetical protein